MKGSGINVKTDNAPIIHRFYSEKTCFLVNYEDFPEDCPLEPELLGKSSIDKNNKSD